MKVSINADSEVKKCLQGFKNYDKATKTRIANVVEKTTDTVFNKAKAKAPMKTGHIRSNIKKEMKYPTVGIVRATSPHAHLIELGTVPRITGPKKKKALRINDGFAKGIISTGKVTPKPFLKPAAEEVKDTFVADLKKALNP